MFIRYEEAYTTWRRRIDKRTLVAMLVWLVAQKLLPKDNTLVRRAAAVFVQLAMCADFSKIFPLFQYCKVLGM